MTDEIIATIDDQGNVTIEVNGVAGRACEQLTKPLEQALGEPAKRTLKPEHRQVAHVQQHVTGS